ncbi:50S ribosomal protein L21 [bacterium]|nr:50S ribosomal protein L21 [bacterium]
MYAIIESGDKQFRVEEGMKIVIPEIEAEKGSLVKFDRVLLCADGENVVVGRPLVAGAHVDAVSQGPVKGEKLTVFKFKKRKNMRRRTGHRQGYTEVKIGKIICP